MYFVETWEYQSHFVHFVGLLKSQVRCKDTHKHSCRNRQKKRFESNDNISITCIVSVSLANFYLFASETFTLSYKNGSPTYANFKTVSSYKPKILPAGKTEWRRAHWMLMCTCEFVYYVVPI